MSSLSRYRVRFYNSMYIASYSRTTIIMCMQHTANSSDTIFYSALFYVEISEDYTVGARDLHPFFRIERERPGADDDFELYSPCPS